MPAEEHRFLPEGRLSPLAWVIAIAGCVVMGFGIYGIWFASYAVRSAPWFMLGGIVTIVVALIVARLQRRVVHVGDAGIALLQRGENVRIPWWQIEAVALSGKKLRITGAEHTIVLPYSEHGQAAAWILREADRRIPERVNKPDKKPKLLPKRDRKAGKKVPPRDVVAEGARCSFSDEPIEEKSTALLCPSCGALFHRKHVPEKCTQCGRRLGDRATQV